MAYRYIKLRRTIMGKLIKTTLLLACTFMLFAVVDDAQAGRQNKLCQLRQDRLEIGRGMLEVQNVDWTTLLQYYSDDIEYHCPIVDVYGFEMLTEFLGRLYGSSPDLVTTIEDETLVGDVYSATWTMVGTSAACPTKPRAFRSSSSVAGAGRFTTGGTTTPKATS
jgi:hypothetical protein